MFMKIVDTKHMSTVIAHFDVCEIKVRGNEATVIVTDSEIGNLIDQTICRTGLKEEIMIDTLHFGKPMPLVSVLYALAAQENNDGDEGNAMQAAAEVLERYRGTLGGDHEQV